MCLKMLKNAFKCNKTKQYKASTAAGQPGLTRWTLGVAAWPTWAWTCPKRRPFRPQLVPLVRGEIPAGGPAEVSKFSKAGRKRKRLMNLFKRCHCFWRLLPGFRDTANISKQLKYPKSAQDAQA